MDLLENFIRDVYLNKEVPVTFWKSSAYGDLSWIHTCTLEYDSAINQIDLRRGRCSSALVLVTCFCDFPVAYTCKDTNPCLFGGTCLQRGAPRSANKVKTPSPTKVTPQPRFKCLCRLGFYGDFCQEGINSNMCNLLGLF